MIEANELRIGNKVYGNVGTDTICTIKDINTYSTSTNIGVSCTKDGYSGISAPIESFNPIPLTEEWLIKFGFKIVGINAEYNWLLLWKNKVTKNFDFVLTEPHSNKRKVTELKYVHQLQNLYFALTGEELI